MVLEPPGRSGGPPGVQKLTKNTFRGSPKKSCIFLFQNVWAANSCILTSPVVSVDQVRDPRRSPSRVLLAIISGGSSGGDPCSQAGVLIKFALISRAHTKITTRTAWVHGGALRAPPCTEAVVVVIFAWAREISANFTRTPAWLHGYPPLLPQTTMV